MAIRQETASRPLLLVSVRNGSEGRAALAGGCDILDIKDPEAGSLGLADVASIREVVQLAGEVGSRGACVPVSAALGEAVDWEDPSDRKSGLRAALAGRVKRKERTGGAMIGASAVFQPPTPSRHESFNSGSGGCQVRSDIVQLPRGLTYVKLGLSGLGGQSDWASRWARVRYRFDKNAQQRLCWVAVAYADWQNARSPQPYDVIDAAQGVCGVFLIDTYNKDGRSLLDTMSGEDYLQIARRTRRLGMRLAVAGSLRSEHLSALGAAPPDIVAIRTAACRGGVRNNRVSVNAVRAFQAAVESSFRGSRFARAPQGHSVKE